MLQVVVPVLLIGVGWLSYMTGESMIDSWFERTGGTNTVYRLTVTVLSVSKQFALIFYESTHVLWRDGHAYVYDSLLDYSIDELVKPTTGENVIRVNTNDNTVKLQRMVNDNEIRAFFASMEGIYEKKIVYIDGISDHSILVVLNELMKRELIK